MLSHMIRLPVLSSCLPCIESQDMLPARVVLTAEFRATPIYRERERLQVNASKEWSYSQNISIKESKKIRGFPQRFAELDKVWQLHRTMPPPR
jgi:hypothetical protein